MPRARAKAREREIARQRDEVATAHRERAEDRTARADYAEQQAARERAEAELHETRARMHERGLADDELDMDRERLGVPADGDTGRGARGDRFAADRDERDAEERDATVPATRAAADPTDVAPGAGRCTGPQCARSFRRVPRRMPRRRSASARQNSASSSSSASRSRSTRAPS